MPVETFEVADGVPIDFIHERGKGPNPTVSVLVSTRRSLRE
jgi:hypothetical protein